MADAILANNKKNISKSLIVFAIKPYGAQTDLNQVAERIKTQVVMEGLVWGEYKLNDIAFGLKKINFSCVIQDDIVLVDDIIDKILQIEQDNVQSVDIQIFQKV